MNDLSPLSDLVADDLLLDRLAGRVDAGSDPLAGLLGALAAHADTPLPLRTGRRRIGNRHRYLGAFAALAVAASGAGVAAAVTVPSHGPSRADRALTVTMTDDSPGSHVPSAPLSRLGLPQTSRSTQAQALVLARRIDGAIVLVPAALVAAPVRPGGGTPGNGETGQRWDGHADDGQGRPPERRQAGRGAPDAHPRQEALTRHRTRASKGTKDATGDGKDVKKPAPTATPAAQSRASAPRRARPPPDARSDVAVPTRRIGQ